MNPVRVIQFSLSVVFAFLAFPAFAADVAEANRILDDEILPTLEIYVSENGDTVKSSTNEEVYVRTTKYVGLDGFLESDTNTSFITFSGTNVAPDTVITVIFPETYVRSSTMANTEGNWSILVPIDQLTAGQHQAVIQTIHDGVRSDEAVVAEFEIEAQESLSNSTWVFLFSSVLAMLCLLFAITLQLRHNMRGFSTDPLL